MSHLCELSDSEEYSFIGTNDISEDEFTDNYVDKSDEVMAFRNDSVEINCEAGLSELNKDSNPIETHAVQARDISSPLSIAGEDINLLMDKSNIESETPATNKNNAETTCLQRVDEEQGSLDTKPGIGVDSDEQGDLNPQNTIYSPSTHGGEPPLSHAGKSRSIGSTGIETDLNRGFNNQELFESFMELLVHSVSLLEKPNLFQEAVNLSKTIGSAFFGLNSDCDEQSKDNLFQHDDNNLAHETEKNTEHEEERDIEKPIPRDPELKLLFATLGKGETVKLVQQFLSEPVVEDFVVDICQSCSAGKSFYEAAKPLAGDLLVFVGNFVRSCPDVLSLMPAIMKLINLISKLNLKHSDVKSEKNQKEEEKPTHDYIECDGCKTQRIAEASIKAGHRNNTGAICGIRWKSTNHPNFDLCSTCEASGIYDSKYGPFIKMINSEHSGALLRVIEKPHKSENKGHCKLPSLVGRGVRLGGRVGKTSKDKSSVNQSKVSLPCKIKPRLICPNGHILNTMKISGLDFTCDACDSAMPFRSLSRCCRDCNFDLCAQCAFENECKNISVAEDTKEENHDQQQEEIPSLISQDKKVSFSYPQASFVSDASLPDGAVLAPGDTAVKAWRIRNSGRSTWPEGVLLMHVGGHKLGTRDSIQVPPLEPNSEFEVVVCIRAPPKPGRYISYWRLFSPGTVNKWFGHRLWCDMTCKFPTCPP